MELCPFERSRLCVEKLRQSGKRVAFAESCTGGLISRYITEHSGASDVFDCGIVSYSGKIKHKILGVCSETLVQYGEVSEETALEMAEGVAKLADADIGIGVTGIAGPTGATKDKKVGLIYVGVFYKKICKAYKLELYDPQMDRAMRRSYTADFVFQKILDLIKQ